MLGIIAADPDQLPYLLRSSSPYTIKTIATRMSELPDSLRHHFRYRLFLDDFAYRNETARSGIPSPHRRAGKKITLAWVAATEDDQGHRSVSGCREFHRGTPIQPEELPQGGRRAFASNWKSESTAKPKPPAPPSPRAAEPIGAGAFTGYFDLTTWDETTDLFGVAGQQTALGLSVQGVSKTQLQTKTRFWKKPRPNSKPPKLPPRTSAPKSSKASPPNTSPADMLTANIWSYFAALQGQGVLASTQAHMFDRPGMSYGLFHALATPSKLYGQFTTGVKFQGVMMDIGHLRHLPALGEKRRPASA